MIRSTQGAELALATSGEAKAGAVREVDAKLGLKLVWCPPGSFLMGSPEADEEALAGEKPQHTVKFTTGFWLGQTEITREQWQAVMGTTPWKDQPFIKEGANFPATSMSWNDAQEFCKRLTEQERKAGTLSATQSFLLPTEAQWEYACRAGTTTEFSFGSGKQEFDPEKSPIRNFAWMDWNTYYADPRPERYAHQVGTKQANPWNLFDMHGNVWEWCQDSYAADTSQHAGTSAADSVAGGSDRRVIRGGCWFSTASAVRSATRFWEASNRHSNYLGLRVIQTP